MWHEARKQEKMIRGLIVDYRRRAERRKDFYEKIKAEPTQFLQLHGRPCKLHLDPAIAAAGEGPAIMMPWQGDSNNMIDRFDVRAHLDFIPDMRYPEIQLEELGPEDRQCNYERYRILAQNVFLGICEDKFLQQLAIEEQFGFTMEEKEKQHEKRGTGAAIGYNYNDPGAQPSSSHGSDVKKVEQKESDDDSDLEIIDVDLSIDVNKMEASQAHELNAVGPQFGMAGCDLFSFLTGDADDAEYQKQLLREEKEKAMFSGRKSRRERRAHRLFALSNRDKKLLARVSSPPSYAAPRARAAFRSPTRSPSPALPPPDNIEFITSFGGEDDAPPLPPKPLYADKLKSNLRKAPTYSEVARKPVAMSRPQFGPQWPPRFRLRSACRPRSRSRTRSRARSKSRSHSRSRSFRRSSYSRSRSVTSRSRSRSRSVSPYRPRTRNVRRHSRNSQSHECSKSYNPKPMSHDSHEYSKSYNPKPMSHDSHECSKSYNPKPMSHDSHEYSKSYNPKPMSHDSHECSKSYNPKPMSHDSHEYSKSYNPKPMSHDSHECSKGNNPKPISHDSHEYSKGNNPKPMSHDSDRVEIGAGGVVPRYYGRRKEDQSSSELSTNSDSSATGDDDKIKSAVGNKSNINPNQFRLSGTSAKGTSREAILLKEKLRRKMQAQLSRQLRLDQRAEAERAEREIRRQQRRDQEMRDLAIKLRRKQREIRHQQNRRSSDSESDRSRSRSSSRESHNPVRRRARERSRSKSSSPQEKRIPAWDARCEPPRSRHHASYQSHHHNSHQSHHDSRWDDRTQPSWRRPYRSSYRDQDYRHHTPRHTDESDKDDEPYPKNKVKLVDY